MSEQKKTDLTKRIWYSVDLAGLVVQLLEIYLFILTKDMGGEMTEILTDIAIKWRRLKLKFQRNLGEC